MGRTTRLRAAAAVPVRRWPWAVAAVVAGACAGGAVAYVLRRVQGTDAPGAVDPDELLAVVDRPDDEAHPPV